MVNCSVKCCKNYSNTKNYVRGTSYFSFPKDPNRKRKWVEALGREECWIPTKTSKVCSAHFEDGSYTISSNGRKLLFVDTVPTKNILCQLAEHCESEKSQETLQLAEPCENVKSQETLQLAGACENKKLQETLHLLSIENKRLKKTIKLKNAKIQQLYDKIRQTKKKVTKFSSIIKTLKEKKIISEDEGTILNNLGVGPHDLLKIQIIKKRNGQVSKIKYTANLRRFALTLHYYSPRAYSYVRKEYDLCLPSPGTLRKWYRTIGGDPGFTNESLETLKNMAQISAYPLVCSFMLDEMAIRRRVEWDGQQYHGYVDFGTGLADECQLAEAKDVLVFLIVGINASWKVPVAYFLVDGVKGEQRANLINQCLINCHETGIKVVSVTSDGCPANISAMKILGCSFEASDLKVTFPHPVTSEPIFIIMDPPHMLKLVRNAFHATGKFYDSVGNEINWSFLEKLNNIQLQELFHMCNKLSPHHINFKNNVMKVKFATQLLSNSVSEALIFCETKLRSPEFKGASATAHFLKVMNDLFNILNSRNVNQKNLHEPLNKDNYLKLFRNLENAKDYLKKLKLPSGKLVVESRRKTGFLGLIICIDSVQGLFQKLVLHDQLLKYLPTYKLSQDHLELLFSNFRAHGGANNNPTARQLKSIYKKILSHVQLRETEGSNCVPLENIKILNCTSAIQKINKTSGMHEDFTEDFFYSETLDYSDIEWSEFGDYIISYIAGYVVAHLIAHIQCEICISALINTRNNLYIDLLVMKDKGGLTFPSKDVINLCRTSESLLRKCLTESGGKFMNTKFTPNYMTSKILKDFVGQLFFEDLREHQFDHTFPETNHVIDLSKAVNTRSMAVIQKYVS